jgi:hypothetical protein
MAITAILLAVLLVGGYLLWRSQAVGGDSPADIAASEESATPPAATAGAGRPAAQQPAPAPANGPVVLTASEDVWLRIDEAGQPKALFQGTLKAGQRFEVPAAAAAPRLRTGRANVLQVTVGGRAVPPVGPPERTVSDVSLRAPDLLARAQASAGAQAPATR